MGHSILENTGPPEEDESKKPTPQPGIQAFSNGKSTNIRPGMLNDQYGMAGVLAFLRTIDKSQGLVTLALGHDLTNLGLNLNSPERNLYQSFGGPFSDHPARTQDIECPVPDEYRTSFHIKDKLPPIKISKLGEDTLFFLFYNCPNEAYQMVAAAELYMRDWRYHKTMHVWLIRSAYGGVKEQTAEYEKGSYDVFDPTRWRKIPQEMTLEYKDLEQRPAQSTAEFKMQRQTNSKLMYSTAAASTPQTPINGFNPVNTIVEVNGKDSINQTSGRHAGLGYLSQLSQQNYSNMNGQLSRGEMNESTMVRVTSNGSI